MLLGAIDRTFDESWYFSAIIFRIAWMSTSLIFTRLGCVIVELVTGVIKPPIPSSFHGYEAFAEAISRVQYDLWHEWWSFWAFGYTLVFIHFIFEWTVRLRGLLVENVTGRTEVLWIGAKLSFENNGRMETGAFFNLLKISYLCGSHNAQKDTCCRTRDM